MSRRIALWGGVSLSREDRRLDRMIEIAEQTGLALDDVVRAIGRVDHKTFRRLSDNPSDLPRYIQSSVRP
jgi:hypothetical protein